MLASSQAVLGILIPMGTVVFIILFILFFLLRNRERLDREIADEQGINFQPRLDKLPVSASRGRQQQTLVEPPASETSEEEVPSPELPV
jgi:predicted PurR-regulated permease PerM